MRPRFFLLILPIIAYIGCTDRDRDNAIQQGTQIGRQAANKVADAAGQAWKSILDRTSKLTPDSAAESLSRARDTMEKALADLKPGERLDAAKAEIDRLRAAIDVKKLREEADQKIAEAQQLKENAGKTIDDVKDKLDAADRAYQDLRKRLDAAQQTYEDAAKKAQDAKQALADLTGSSDATDAN